VVLPVNFTSRTKNINLAIFEARDSGVEKAEIEYAEKIRNMRNDLEAAFGSSLADAAARETAAAAAAQHTPAAASPPADDAVASSSR